MPPAQDPTADNSRTASGAPGAGRNERKVVLLICLLAAIHVFFFSAAFPFFNSVDEPMHFDLVVKYSHGHLPQRKLNASPDAATYLALFSSCAYFGIPGDFPGGQMPAPPWTEPVQKMQSDLLLASQGWQLQQNYEVSQPPLYYTLAGLAWRTGVSLHMDAGHLLYSLRFLNIAFLAIVVILGYVAARIIFPENLFLRLGVPLVIAVMPQTAFYSIGNDILSPLFFGLTFICLLKWMSSEKPSLILGVSTGLSFAATYLSKTTNLPLLAVAAFAVLFLTAQNLRRYRNAASIIVFASFAICVVLPILSWMLWCRHSFGDLTGSKLKIEHFGWTLKPFGEWWHHPIFSFTGIWTYLLGQLATFWQGEFVWHNQPMALRGSNATYTVLSLLLLGTATVTLFPRFSKITSPQRHALGFSLIVFVAGLAFFALMSVIYDFHDCPNPSRDHPFFQAGRMLLGALIPFLLLVMYGLDRLLCRLGNIGKFLTLAILLCAMLALEIVTDWPAFSNPFNWFHLP